MNPHEDFGRINDERTDLTAADHDRLFGALDQLSAPLRRCGRRAKPRCVPMPRITAIWQNGPRSGKVVMVMRLGSWRISERGLGSLPHR